KRHGKTKDALRFSAQSVGVDTPTEPKSRSFSPSSARPVRFATLTNYRLVRRIGLSPVTECIAMPCAQSCTLLSRRAASHEPSRTQPDSTRALRQDVNHQSVDGEGF